jgi:hypothetical protein
VTNENYEHIFYLDCPHFTVGRVDQWGEQGYLLFEGTVYAYEEDRKNQTGRTYSPMSLKDFLAFAKAQELVVPDAFMDRLLEDLNGQPIF